MTGGLPGAERAGSAITITDLADVCAGDIVTFAYEGHRYTGPTYGASFDTSGRALCVAGLLLRTADGRPSSMVAFISATREVPDLPTEPNSVIKDVEVKVAGTTKTFPLGRLTSDGWMLYTSGGSPRYVEAAQSITAWTPAEVVVTGERVTR